MGSSYKATDKTAFLRILCAAPTSQDLRGILFSTGRPARFRCNGVHNLLGSPPPPLKQTVFPKAILKTSRTAVVVFLHIYFPAKLFRHSFLLFCRFPIQDFDASTPLLCPWTSCHFGSTAAPLVAGGRILLAACQPQPQEGQTVEEAKVHQ